jgi:hypothetical protein
MALSMLSAEAGWPMQGLGACCKTEHIKQVSQGIASRENSLYLGNKN